MPIECFTNDRVTLIRVLPHEDGSVDFGELSAMAGRLFHGNIGGECVLSFPDNFLPAGKQMGSLILWANTMCLGGGTFGIVTSNRMFLEKLKELVFAFKIRIYESEKEIYE